MNVGLLSLVSYFDLRSITRFCLVWSNFMCQYATPPPLYEPLCLIGGRGYFYLFTLFHRATPQNISAGIFRETFPGSYLLVSMLCRFCSFFTIWLLSYIFTSLYSFCIYGLGKGSLSIFKVYKF